MPIVLQGYPVMRCPGCGLRFLDPQPDDAVLGAIYSEGYFLADDTPESEGRFQQLKGATARLQLGLLERSPAGRRLLEIGCGRGDFLVEARALGFKVRGLEVSSHSAAMANRRLQEDCVSVGTLETAGLPERSFDVIALIDVLEHVRDPRRLLKSVHAALDQGGAILLVTPSVESWSARLLRRHWMEYKPEHLHYFGPHSLRRLLVESGFEEVRIAPSRKVLSLDYVVRHFRRFPVPVLTGLLSAAGRVTPQWLAHRATRVPAGGMAATATKARPDGERRPGSEP